MGGGVPAGFWQETRITPVPYLTRTSDKFLDSFRVEMKCNDPKAEIRYTLDGSTPVRNSRKYENAFDVSNTTTLKMRTYAEGEAPGLVVTRVLTKSEAIAPVQRRCRV